MCVPALAAVSGLVSVLGSVAGFVGQSQAAKQQEAYQQRQFEAREKERLENAENANKSFIEESAQLGIKQQQQQVVAAEEKQDVDIDRQKVAGEALASSQSSGLGLSNVLGDLFRQQGRYNSTIETQLKYDLDQGNNEVSGLRAKAIDRINSVRPYIPQPVNRPSPLALVANVAGGFVNTASKYKIS